MTVERTITDTVEVIKPSLPEWKRNAEELRKHRFSSIVITDRISPTQIITGFILTKVGVVAGDNGQQPIVYTRDSTFLHDFGRNRGVPLFNRAMNNPSTLRALVEDSTLEQIEKSRLRRLADFLGFYRSYPDEQWWLAQKDIKNSKKLRGLDLHRIFLKVIEADASFPEGRYEKCQKILENLIKSDHFELSYFFSPAEVTVPVIKSQPGEADILEQAIFVFDRSKVMYLNRTRTFISIGGSPNSGKSTFVASLTARMGTLVSECVRDGILDEDEVNIGFCDLDLTSPTATYIMSNRRRKIEGTKKQWDLRLFHKAYDKAQNIRHKNTITLLDLPGGTPDWLTWRLSTLSRYSILLDKNYGENLNPWRKFVQNPPKTQQDYWDESGLVTTNLIHIHTVLESQGRSSGVREYHSLDLGGRRNFLRGRIVGLRRERKTNDPMINLVAHVLLFDFFPNSRIRELDYKACLRLSQKYAEIKSEK